MHQTLQFKVENQSLLRVCPYKIICELRKNNGFPYIIDTMPSNNARQQPRVATWKNAKFKPGSIWSPATWRGISYNMKSIVLAVHGRSVGFMVLALNSIWHTAQSVKRWHWSAHIWIETSGQQVRPRQIKNKRFNMKNDTILILLNVILWFAILPLISHFI